MNFHPTQASAAKWAPDRSGLPARGRTRTVVRSIAAAVLNCARETMAVTA